MSMKNQWLINITMVILPWLTLPFLGVRGIMRFLPSSILIVLLEAINVQLGKRRKWWVFYNKPKSYITNEFPFNIGPFLVGSMWILKWTYGSFKKFIFLNAIVDGFFAFIIVRLTEKLKVAKLVRLNNFQFFLYFFYKAFLLYGFQYIIEGKKELTKRFVN
ncbi:hypothetical protein [Metabacillus sediminilitoris]|uniref:Uncharacterized protein n=1 Tax=Metabacillus sediminilitoris TaxID=2567941 RepID=A0A4S4BIA4_9BACI|nr:hypothetical protein [Metabacillus sediminilitoris]QGQ45778.1 hypothetical protein GMB29_11355 [Metabacillus sediminilitoris]THF74334.1 hypothetical protein E6W99_25395 [Metabacillus sediminilitoris]